MGRIGALTGYPVLRVAVARPSELGAVAGRNLLLLGSITGLEPATDLLYASPYHVQNGRLQVELPGGFSVLRRLFGGGRAARDQAATALSAAVAPSTAAMVGARSPLDAGRSVVALLGGSPAAVHALVTTLRDPQQAPLIQGDLALLAGDRVTAYRVGDQYSIGSLPFWVYPSWLLQGQPLAVAGVMLGGCALVAAVYFVALRRRAALRTTSRIGHPPSGLP
jgi:cellulose synthase (UDP-forming)